MVEKKQTEKQLVPDISHGVPPPPPLCAWSLRNSFTDFRGGGVLFQQNGKSTMDAVCKKKKTKTEKGTKIAMMNHESKLCQTRAISTEKGPKQTNES